MTRRRGRANCFGRVSDCHRLPIFVEKSEVLNLAGAVMSLADAISSLFREIVCVALFTVLTGCASAGPTTEPTPTDTGIAPSPTPVSPATPAPSTELPTIPPTIENPTTATVPTKEEGNADVLYVRAVLESSGTWTFHVTVEHPDTGWEDYADGWDVVTPAGEVLRPDRSSQFTRLLLHPHENEQPFTRSQSGIVIPKDVTQVRVRAHDIVDGYGGREVVVDLMRSSGPDFEVQR